MTQSELVIMAKGWLRHAPLAPKGPVDLLGFTGPVGFVCSDCAGRIIARGCNLKQLASVPVWVPATAPACAVCLRLPAERSTTGDTDEPLRGIPPEVIPMEPGPVTLFDEKHPAPVAAYPRGRWTERGAK